MDQKESVMEKQVKMWHLLLGLILTIGSQFYNRGTLDEKNRLTLEYQQKQLNEQAVNIGIDRKENKERDDRIMNMLMDIQLILKDKQDREK